MSQVTRRPRALAARIAASAAGRRDVREVQPAAGQLEQAQVALDHHRLGRRRDAGEAQARGERPLVHHPVLGQRRLLGVLDDQRVEAGGVGQRAAHHPRVGQRPLAVGEGHGTRGLEQADLGQLLPRAAAW